MSAIEAIDAAEDGGENALPAMSRTERAAIFLTLLGEEEATSLLSRLGPGELERLGGAMCALGEINQSGIAEAIGDFVAEADREILPARDRSPEVRALLTQALGETKAESMMQRIRPERRPRSIEMARWLAPNVLLKLVDGEHPQVIAVLLLMLEAEPAAEVLSSLPESLQSVVVERIARIGPISTQAVDMIDNLLSQRIGANFGANALMLGGPREAADLINRAAGEVRTTVLPVIAQTNPSLAEAIEEQMFTFEMLLDLDPQAMGRLLRDVDNEALVDALKGLKEDKRAPFFAAMSSRAADGIRDDIELRGRLAKSDVEAAQRAIIETACNLADQGEIAIGADDGEFV